MRLEDCSPIPNVIHGLIPRSVGATSIGCALQQPTKHMTGRPDDGDKPGSSSGGGV